MVFKTYPQRESVRAKEAYTTAFVLGLIVYLDLRLQSNKMAVVAFMTGIIQRRIWWLGPTR